MVLALGVGLLAADCSASPPAPRSGDLTSLQSTAGREPELTVRYDAAPRAELLQPDAAQRVAAARSLNPFELTAAELAVQAQTLAGDIGWLLSRSDSPLANPLGALDAVRAWTTLAESEECAALECAPAICDELEDVTRPQHIPQLAELRRRAPPAIRRALLTAMLHANFRTHEHDELVALCVLDEVGSDGARPGRSDPLPGRGGLPETWRRLVRVVWRLYDESPWGTSSWANQADWAVQKLVMDWADACRPAADDIPLLLRIAADTAHAEWAVRTIGRIPGSAADGALAVLYRSGGDAAVVAGGELVARERLSSAVLREAAITTDDERGDASLIALWRARPEEAREVCVERLLRRLHTLDLSPGGRARLEQEHDLNVRDEDIDWIGARLLAAPDASEVVVRFFATASACRIRECDAVTLLSRLVDAGDAQAPQALTLLTALEPHGAAELIPVLHTWIQRWRGAARDAALLASMRLGDPRAAGEVLGRWRRGALDLGCGSGVGARSALRDAAESMVRGDDAAERTRGCGALAMLGGLPWRAAVMLDWSEPPLDAELPRLRAGDAVGALLEVAPPSPGAWSGDLVAALACSTDERVMSALRRVRALQEAETYWPATYALSISGDSGAREEWRQLMVAQRCWIIAGAASPLVNEAIACVHRDGSAARHEVVSWTEQLGSGAKLSFEARSVLFAMLPTVVTDPDLCGAVQREQSRVLAAVEYTHLVRSYTIPGWVPALRAR